MPSETTPRMVAAPSVRSSRVRSSWSCAPTPANAMCCPAAMLGAPQTTVLTPAPVSTVASRKRSALGWRAQLKHAADDDALAPPRRGAGQVGRLDALHRETVR